MSKLILPDNLAPKPSPAAHLRGQSLASMDQVVNIAGNMVGPVAIILDEAMGKIARLEDKLGITDATADDVTTGTTYLTPRLTAIEERIAKLEDRIQALEPPPPHASIGGDV